MRLAALVFLGFVLAGAAPAAAGHDAEFLVGFAQDDMSNDWRAAQVRGVEKAFEQHPDIAFTHTDAGGSTARNVLDIERLMDRGIDLLMVSPRSKEAMTAPIARVHRQGVPVVLLTRRIASDAYTTFIAPDDKAIARRAGNVLVDALDGRGRVLMLEGVPTATTAVARTRGFKAAVADVPGVRLVASRVGNYKRQDAIQAVEDVLADGIAFDAIFAQSDSMAVGARLALRAHNIDPHTVPMVGIDYIQAAREAIRNGTQVASFTYPTCAKPAADIAARILHGRDVPRQVTVESTMVTEENVNVVDPIF